MIIYSHDANTILLCPMKSKLASEFQQTYDEIYTYLTQRKFKSKFYRIYNKLVNSTLAPQAIF